ncbi:MAG: DUF222 domain-containing protein [Geodermatophilaceae bacterium]
MTTVLNEPGLSGLAHARGVVRAAAATELWSLTDRQLAAEIADAVALRAQADAVLLARLGEADARGLARTRGATSMVAWLRGSHRLSASEASGLVRTARALRGQLPATAAAMTRGSVAFAQAEVIVDSLKDLSDGIGPELRADARPL